MNVVAHQNVCMQRNLVIPAGPLHQLQAVPAILVVDKHRPTVDPTLGDMQR